jgi:putative transport protein
VADLLVDNPLLTLAVVVGLGGLVGAIRVKGLSLGPAAALFLGLAVSAWDERVALPDIVLVLGLALFVYLVGLDAGPSLRVSLDRRAVVAGAGVVAITAVGAGVAVVAGEVLELSAGTRDGLFAGSLTNTPALAAAVEQLEPGDPAATVGYSLAYPLGIVVMLVATAVALRRPAGHEGGPVTSATVRVGRDEVGPVGGLRALVSGPVSFSRARVDGRVRLADDDLVLRRDDLLVVVGAEDDVATLTDHLGERSEQHLPLDRRALDFRRMVASDRAVIGVPLSRLDLRRRFGAVATRVRRGDADLVATGDLVLRAGDRVRVVAPRERLDEVAAVLGDSERRVSELDGAALGLGLAAGILVGLVPIPLPGGSFELGNAGGPLLVGLALGMVGRTGRLTWALPSGVNATLRQFGALLFFAAVGTRSGSAFADEVVSIGGLELVLAGAVITAVAGVLGLVLGRLTVRTGPAVGGLLAGLQTQPAVLTFASERSEGDDRVNVGYAMVFPAAMIAKIVLAQVLAGGG